MGSAFDPQILVEKLAGLNISKESIQNLSRWCICHMLMAQLVVEIWGRQFYQAPCEQRVAFLYLANDILQVSRWKGSEFLDEFWKVLPDALRYIIESGDEAGRNAAIRLVNIWDERKVFGSRGQLLKEEVTGRLMEKSNRDKKPSESSLRDSGGNLLAQIGTAFQVVLGGQRDEADIVHKCRNATRKSRNAARLIENLDKGIERNVKSKNDVGSILVETLQEQNIVLGNCIEQLLAVETSRANLVSHLKEALQEQELKLDQVRNEIQAAKSQSEQASDLCRIFLKNDNTITSISTEGPSSEHHPKKKAKLDSGKSCYVPPQLPQEVDVDAQPSPPLFPPPVSPPLPPMEPYPAPPLSSPPVPPPLPPMEPYPVPPTAGPMNSSFGYPGPHCSHWLCQAIPLWAPYPMMNNVASFAAPIYSHQSIQGFDVVLYRQSSSFSATPISRA